jgi:glycosyltransferase involved in cell wall biosynthesis
MTNDDKIDILYVAWNRHEFTSRTFEWLLAHTPWRLVNKLVVYDDGSEDGTQAFLRDTIKRVPYAKGELRLSDLRSPPAIMNHYLATAESDWFAKIDNDIALPGGWFEALIAANINSPGFDLIGMEAGMIELEGRDGKKWDHLYQITESTHIGGVGFMRTRKFKENPRIPERGRFGFTEWQDRYGARTGWITPDLLCPQLDRIPVEPFLSLSEQYVEEGWQREWPKYSEEWMEPYWSWMLGGDS